MAEHEPRPTSQVSPDQPRGSKRFSVLGALTMGSIATVGGFSVFDLCIKGLVTEHQYSLSNQWQAVLELAGGLVIGAVFGLVAGDEPKMFIPNFLKRN